MKYIILAIAILGIGQISNAQTKTYNWDVVHSNINFEVDYLKISEVTGRFTNSSGSFTYSDEKFKDAIIKVTANVSSINTDNEKRDGHLKSADFFDSEKFPTIVFESTGFKKVSNNQYDISGTLTMKGITKTIITNAKYLGETQDAYGQTYSLWKVNFTVNRQDYGVSFNKTNAAGDLVLGDEVRMSINAKFLLEK
ncbi:MAG: YceI family protein [Flavobacteriaceae bacterium]